MFSILRLAHFVNEIRSSPYYNPCIHEAQINDEINIISPILKQLRPRLATEARGPIAPRTLPPYSEVFELATGITDMSFGYRLMAAYMLTIVLRLVQNTNG
jgi:hypothetical protein